MSNKRKERATRTEVKKLELVEKGEDKNSALSILNIDKTLKIKMPSNTDLESVNSHGTLKSRQEIKPNVSNANIVCNVKITKDKNCDRFKRDFVDVSSNNNSADSVEHIVFTTFDRICKGMHDLNSPISSFCKEPDGMVDNDQGSLYNQISNMYDSINATFEENVESINEQQGHQKRVNNTVHKDNQPFEDHIKTHRLSQSKAMKQDGRYPCVSCDLTFKCRKERNSHERSIHRINNDDGYRCYQCGMVCKSSSLFKRHLLTHSNLRTFSCDHCGIGFKSEKSLKRHLAMIRERHFCSVCGKGFSTIGFLIEHKERLHLKRNSFQCDLCGKIFYTKKTISTHIKSVHEKHVNAPARCEVCGKKFLRSTLMRKHFTRTHLSPGSFTCNDCSAVFKNKAYLTTHMQMRHLPPTFRCVHCLKMFHSYQNLYCHLRSAHPVDNQSSFLCPACGKQFKDKDRLMNHQRIHSGEKPEVCEVCGKSFRTSTNLYQHARTHSNLRPFKCAVCEKAFRIKHHLKQHMATHGMASVPKYGRRGKKHLEAGRT